MAKAPTTKRRSIKQDHNDVLSKEESAVMTQHLAPDSKPAREASVKPSRKPPTKDAGATTVEKYKPKRRPRKEPVGNTATHKQVEFYHELKLVISKAEIEAIIGQLQGVVDKAVEVKG